MADFAQLIICFIYNKLKTIKIFLHPTKGTTLWCLFFLKKTGNYMTSYFCHTESDKFCHFDGFHKLHILKGKQQTKKNAGQLLAHPAFCMI